MIESKEQLVSDFRAKAEAFFAEPGLITGIDFDDAAVTLKRYVLSELGDQVLGSRLADIPGLIRRLDVGSLRDLVAEVDQVLGA